MIKKIIPVAAVIIIAAIVLLSTGAFTSVTAERTAVINVAGDSSALVGLAACTGDGNNGGYVSTNNGAIEIDLTTIADGGVNVNAVTILDNVFSITNNGTQDISVTIVGSYEGVGDGHPNAVSIYFDGTSTATTATINTATAKNVSLKIDTTGDTFAKGDHLIDTITITATAVQAST